MTANPPAGAALLSVTVHVDDPGAFTFCGTQARLLTVTGGVRGSTVIPPSLPPVGIMLPLPLADERALRTTGRLPLAAPGAMVKANVATVPFPIVVSLMPTTRHVAVPLP